MSGSDKNRSRNQTISFRVSLEERRQLEARIKISGMPNGEYIIQSCLRGELNIRVGKYQSDRLSLELKRLRECLEKLSMKQSDGEMFEMLDNCRALLEQLEIITSDYAHESEVADGTETKAD